MPSKMVVATCQAALLSAVSNVLAQFSRSYNNKTNFVFDALELLRYVALTFITCPPNYKWQQFLERTFPAHPTRSDSALPMTQSDIEKRRLSENIEEEPKPKLSIKNTLAKWFIDCMTIGALVNTAIFVALMGLMKGQDKGQIYSKVKTETLPIIWASYKVWPVVSIINFSFVPVERRIVFLSLIGVLWGVYMSLVAARI